MKLAYESLVSSLGHHTFFIQNGQKSVWLGFNQIQDGLVIFEFNICPFDLLPCVLFLLHFENMAVEELLDLFIGKVDAQLLEAIFFKVFKSKNIKDSNKLVCRRILSC